MKSKVLMGRFSLIDPSGDARWFTDYIREQSYNENLEKNFEELTKCYRDLRAPQKAV